MPRGTRLGSSYSRSAWDLNCDGCFVFVGWRIYSDTSDPDASLGAVLRLLPNVNCEILAMYADGIARDGWVYKEGQHYGTPRPPHDRRVCFGSTILN